MAVPRIAAHLRRAVPLVAAVGLLAGCGTSGGNDASPATTSTTGATATAPPDTAPVGEDYGEDDCPSAEAVGKVADAALDRSMSFGSTFAGDIGTSGTGCSYRPTDASSSDDEITIRRITTEADLSGTLFAALDKAAAADARENGFAELDGLGDAAYLDGQEVVMHVGDAMAFVEYDPAPKVDAGARSAAEDLAAEVADLDIDPTAPPECDDLRPMIRERHGKITAATGHSGFIGFGDDISITTSGCSLTLDDETEITIAVAPDDHWDDWVADKADSPFTASYASTTVLGRAAYDDGEVLVVDDGTGKPGDSPYEIGAEGFGLDDAGAAALRLAVAELVLGG